MKRVFFMFAAACFSLLMVVSNSAEAHYVSITVDNYHPNPGDEIIVNIGWGHKFPGDGQMRHGIYAKINLEIIDPDGHKTSIPVIPEPEKGNKPVRVKIGKQGFYTLVLTRKSFSTKTTDGYKDRPKNELEHVLHSRWSETVSEAVIVAGTPEKAFPVRETGDRFQVIALENPLKVEKGNFLPVKLTLDGKPWRGMIYCTYAGFSDMENTFAYTTRTDKNGIAKIRMLEQGLWLIKADHAYPYENKDAADEYSLIATLTFKN